MENKTLTEKHGTINLKMTDLLYALQEIYEEYESLKNECDLIYQDVDTELVRENEDYDGEFEETYDTFIDSIDELRDSIDSIDYALYKLYELGLDTFEAISKQV